MPNTLAQSPFGTLPPGESKSTPGELTSSRASHLLFLEQDALPPKETSTVPSAEASGLLTRLSTLSRQASMCPPYSSPKRSQTVDFIGLSHSQFPHEHKPQRAGILGAACCMSWTVCGTFLEFTGCSAEALPQTHSTTLSWKSASTDTPGLLPQDSAAVGRGMSRRQGHRKAGQSHTMCPGTRRTFGLVGSQPQNTRRSWRAATQR